MYGIEAGGISEDVELWVRDSLFALGGVYTLRGDGTFVYEGIRPGEEWHGHGYFPKWLTMLVSGVPTRVRIYKHRWIHTETGKTMHSRPPDDPVMVRFCSLIVMLRIWGWVSSSVGFYNRTEVFEGLDTDCGSDRTVQRWTRDAMLNGIAVQQAIRLAIIEEREPRPVEKLFDGGLSPPDAVTKRRWKSSENLNTLYRGYAMLLVTARELAQHASYLLAGARRRMPNAEKTFGI
jgi:hypothetical protein